MYSLFLDHSFSREVLALFKDKTLCEEAILSRTMGEHPSFVWQGMLEASGIKLYEVDFFVCGTGPGSYTGMRGAASTVKAVAFALDKPIVSASSLLLLCPWVDGSYLLVKDAKIAGFYAQSACVEHGMVSCGPPEIISASALKEEVDRGNLVLCEEFDEAACKNGAKVSSLGCRAVAPYAFEAFARGDVFDSENLPMTYLRKTQAELERFG